MRIMMNVHLVQFIGKELKDKNVSKKVDKMKQIKQGLEDLGSKYKEVNDKVAWIKYK